MKTAFKIFKDRQKRHKSCASSFDHFLVLMLFRNDRFWCFLVTIVLLVLLQSYLTSFIGRQLVCIGLRCVWHFDYRPNSNWTKQRKSNKKIVYDRSLGRSFSPIRGLKSNWSIIVTPVTRNPFHPPKNRNSDIKSNRYFFKTHPTALSLFLFHSLFTLSLITVFCSRPYTTRAPSYICPNLCHITNAILSRRHVRRARAHSQIYS